MADVHKVSDQMIEFAERMANVADAAQGRAARRGGIPTSWLVLPAAGAGFYALVKSGVITRGAKGMADDVKTRAAALPDDLLNRVRQTSQKPKPASANGAQKRRPTSRQKTRTRASTRKSGSSAG